MFDGELRSHAWRKGERRAGNRPVLRFRGQKNREKEFRTSSSAAYAGERANICAGIRAGASVSAYGISHRRKAMGKATMRKGRPLSDTMREQAFEFAMALLLPREEFEKALLNASDKNFADISEVSKHFNVSVSLALKQGRDLGYIA